MLTPIPSGQLAQPGPIITPSTESSRISSLRPQGRRRQRYNHYAVKHLLPIRHHLHHESTAAIHPPMLRHYLIVTTPTSPRRRILLRRKLRTRQFILRLGQHLGRSRGSSRVFGRKQFRIQRRGRRTCCFGGSAEICAVEEDAE